MSFICIARIRFKFPIKFIEMLNGGSVEKISTKNEPDVQCGQKCRLAILLFLFLYKEYCFAFISLYTSVLLSGKVMKEGSKVKSSAKVSNWTF